MPGSVAGNVDRGKMNSDYTSVTQQTGLKAGDGGFLIDMGGNTTLIGSVISSSQQAVADGLNHLSTGTLRVEDIRNHAEYSASQVSVGGGFSFGGGGGETAGQGGVGQDKHGNVAAGGNAKPASSVPSDKSGLSMGLPVALSASGSASSTTRSGISEGVIEIRDEAGQQALTGKSAAETIASLNRDTTDTLGALKPIFDKEKIEAGFEIGTAFAGEMGQFLANRAKEADALEKAVEAETDPIRQAQLQAQFDDAKKWGPGGEYRQVMTVIAASAGGNVMGGAGEFVQAAAVNYLHSLGAGQIKKIADDLGGEGSVGHIALHAVLACAGAAGQGASCGAGAVGASASVVLHTLLANVSGKKADELGAEDQEARLNAVTGLLAGITSMLDPSAAAAVANAARIEGENNYLSAHQAQEFDNELRACRASEGNCSAVLEKWFNVHEEQSAQLVGKLKDDPLAALGWDKELALAGLSQAERPQWLASMGLSVMTQEEARLYVQEWNSRDLTAIDTSSPGWAEFANFVADPLNQLSIATGGLLANDVTRFALSYMGRNTSSVTVSAAEIGMTWGKGISKQGMPWEDYIGTQLKSYDRLPANFKTFDYYDASSKVAVSVKSLDTQAMSRLSKPNQIYGTIAKDINSAANFSGYALSRVELTSSAIASREIQLAIPASTTKTQWAEINRAIEYGKSQGVKVVITQVK